MEWLRGAIRQSRNVTNGFRRVACAMLALAAVGCASVPTADLQEGGEGIIRYASSFERLTLEGQLQFPSATGGRVPAIVLAHGSGGRNDNQERWASFFREQGYATFIIDYFGPRGIRHNSDFQPTPLADAIDALGLLSTHPRIDPKRIAIIGFSRGAHLAYEAANRGSLAPNEPRYAAHVALYPNCSALGVGAAGLSAPVLVLIGERDELSPPAQCAMLAQRASERGAQFTLKVYAGAYHGWDGSISTDYYHRALKRTYRMEANTEVTAQSRKDVLEFLRPLLVSAQARSK